MGPEQLLHPGKTGLPNCNLIGQGTFIPGKDGVPSAY